MPIYEYRCSECGHELEALQKLADARLLNCPACHADALVKKVSAAGFQLKGSGWYVTDFRNGSKSKPAAKTDDSAAKSDAPASDAKADAKPDTKSDAAPKTEAASKGESAPKTETAAKPASAKSESVPAKKPAAAPSSGGSSS
ncbi:MAG TPA: FmdB family zinc ribbon protein [Casimicrobiaceae bacterium]